MFIKLSFQYWKKHIKRLSSMAVLICIGAATMCLALLFIRSNKQIILNKELNLLGDYDACFYEIKEVDLKHIYENDRVKAVAFYRELGYAGLESNPNYKVVSFPNEESISIYHMTCVKGGYPKNKDEVAIDVKAAKELGVIPALGSKLYLYFTDKNREYKYSKEYTISGIFESSSLDAYGGFYRYPVSIDSYDVPSICLCDSESEKFGEVLVSAFIQTDDDIVSVVKDIKNSEFDTLTGIDIPNGRTYAYSYVLGIIDHINEVYGEISIKSLKNAMQTGDIWKDFYSSIVVPIFAGLISIIIVLSVISLIRNNLIDRACHIAVLRSIGISKRQMFIYIFLELMTICSVFMFAGIITGIGIHYVMINIINQIYGEYYPSGIRVYKISNRFSLFIYIYYNGDSLFYCCFLSTFIFYQTNTRRNDEYWVF